MTETSAWVERAEVMRNKLALLWPAHADDEFTIAKRSSRDGTILYRCPTSSRSDIDLAVARARAAFDDGRWATTPIARRAEALNRFANLIDAHAEELALMECIDVGKPISDALNVDAPRAAQTIRHCAALAENMSDKEYARSQTSVTFQLRRPIGVVAGIVGWNYPLVLAANKIGPALIAGNCLILKPSELTNLSAWRLSQLALAAGIPEDVLTVVHGRGEVGATLAEHDEVNLITFTGSTATGGRLMQAAGRTNMKRLILECGGKTPGLVFADCWSLPAVADQIVARAFANQGQVCTAVSRLLVERSIYDQMIEFLVERASSLVPGDPLLETTRFGALVGDDHKAKVLGFIDRATDAGARVAYTSAGPAPFEHGAYVGPQILADVPPDAEIAKQEVFGPVLSIVPFETEPDAVRIANDTIYGLSAVAWTADAERAKRLAKSIDVGLFTAISTARPTGAAGAGVVPIEGHKQSGLGIEGGIEGIEAYTSSSAVQAFFDVGHPWSTTSWRH